jgi:hypothetical protein
MTEQVPDWAKVWLHRDVAQWLHALADAKFQGDVEAALNATVRSVMNQQREPRPQDQVSADPWGDLIPNQRPPGYPL